MDHRSISRKLNDQKSKPESSQLGTYPATTSKPASRQSQNTAGGRARALNIFAAPPFGGAGRAGSFVRISESERSGKTPPPAAGRCPKLPKIDHVFAFKKYAKEIQKLGSLGATQNQTKSTKIVKTPS